MSLFYGLYYFVLRKENFFQLNRFFLIASLIISFLIPLPNLTLSGLEKSGAATYLGLDEQIVAEVSTISVFEKAGVFGLDKILFVVYLIGVAAMLMKLLLGIVYVLRLRMTSKIEQKNTYTLVKVEKPYTVFSFLNMIFWNEDLKYEKEETDQILLHELVHVRQRHSLDIIFVELITAILWFFPFVYWYKSSLKNTHEFIADGHLYQTESYQLKYLDLLMKEAQIQHGNSLSVVHTFFDDQLVSRLKMLNNSDKKSNKIRLLPVLPLMLGLLFFFACNKDLSPVIQTQTGQSIKPMTGQIYQACDVDENGMITLDDGRMVTIDEMKDIVVERRKAEGDLVTKDQVFIISKEEMRKNVKLVK